MRTLPSQQQHGRGAPRPGPPGPPGPGPGPRRTVPTGTRRGAVTAGLVGGAVLGDVVHSRVAVGAGRGGDRGRGAGPAGPPPTVSNGAVAGGGLRPPRMRRVGAGGDPGDVGSADLAEAAPGRGGGLARPPRVAAGGRADHPQPVPAGPHALPRRRRRPAQRHGPRRPRRRAPYGWGCSPGGTAPTRRHPTWSTATGVWINALCGADPRTAAPGRRYDPDAVDYHKNRQSGVGLQWIVTQTRNEHRGERIIISPQQARHSTDADTFAEDIARLSRGCPGFAEGAVGACYDGAMHAKPRMAIHDLGIIPIDKTRRNAPTTRLGPVDVKLPDGTETIAELFRRLRGARRRPLRRRPAPHRTPGPQNRRQAQPGRPRRHLQPLEYP